MPARRRIPALLLLAACSSPPAPAPGDPPPLVGAARDRLRAELAKFDGPDGPSPLHGSPGFVTVADGERVPYDRYCLVGSDLGQDRGRTFDAFVAALRADGGEFRTLERRAAGEPSKILVALDGKRIVVSTLQW